ncbi:unnamed protein product [Pleuronectes platessa]|uniref:Uncharacterized protein n=1 Tax=Pleuronectes platessa TaxID=8262 RepID=A0A9N7YIY0_PLEPL|nr:unnamed protein product [Pleuronectes platessa]
MPKRSLHGARQPRHNATLQPPVCSALRFNMGVDGSQRIGAALTPRFRVASASGVNPARELESHVTSAKGSAGVEVHRYLHNRAAAMSRDRHESWDWSTRAACVFYCMFLVTADVEGNDLRLEAPGPAEDGGPKCHSAIFSTEVRQQGSLSAGVPTQQPTFNAFGGENGRPKYLN